MFKQSFDFFTVLLILGSLVGTTLVLVCIMEIRESRILPAASIRRARELASANRIEDLHDFVRTDTSYLANAIRPALVHVGGDRAALREAAELAASEESARWFRKIEILNVIGNLGPLIGLAGTVWGMILAFGEFAINANPQPRDLAPAISLALVTTLQGLVVAVPALAAFAWFRSRVDEFVAEASLLAEHVLSPVKRQILGRRRTRAGGEQRPVQRGNRPPVPPVAIEREPPP